MAKTAIIPTREDNYPEWYQQVVKEAELAESSPVRGCMIIRPWGQGIWERIQRLLDDKFKETGHENAYFPLLIPLSFLEKEAEHVDGFAKECAVVTHHRLKGQDGGLVPDGELEEPYVIRPTSETIIGHAFSRWINSHRDLPLLLNQWANVMRWEMRPRVFLRTAEFLWQEGHTAHATKEEALEETLKMLDVYSWFAEEVMAMPVIKGEKTPDERFPGADNTYTIEALMQDGKALQAGTSHFLGQNFSKAQNIMFSDKDGNRSHAWTTSWGVSTRLIGGLIMTHSDDNGLVLPPRLAPQQILIVPIFRNESEQNDVLEYCEKLALELKGQSYAGESIRVKIDTRDMRGGEKNWQAIKKGVPLKIEVGPRDMASDSVFTYSRHNDPKSKVSMPRAEFVQRAPELLAEIQTQLFAQSLERRSAQTTDAHDLSSFEEHFDTNNGFVTANWSESAIDHPVLKRLKVTPRCIPLEGSEPTGTCIFTGEKAKAKVVFARSY